MIKELIEREEDIYLTYYISKLNPLTNYESKESIKELIYTLYIIFDDFKYDPYSYLILNSKYLELEQTLSKSKKREYLDNGEYIYNLYKRNHTKALTLYNDWLKHIEIVDVFKVYNLILPKKTTINRLIKRIEDYFLSDQNLNIEYNLKINEKFKHNNLIKENIYKSLLNELLNKRLITIEESELLKEKIKEYGSRSNKS